MQDLRILTARLALILIGVSCAQPAAPPRTEPAQPAVARPGEVYKVGVNGAITGPVASTYAPGHDGLKAYVDWLNERGGVNGRPVELISLDDRAEPTRTQVNAKRLVDEDSTSAGYEPVIGAARGANTPLLFAGAAICPQQVMPPTPDPLVYCASFNVLATEPRATAKGLADLRGGQDMKLALVAMDIPISRQIVDILEAQAKAAGIDVVAKVATPPTATDYTPFATRFTEAGANWAAHQAPLEVGIGIFGALTKLGWNGKYVLGASPTAEQELLRMRHPDLYVQASYAFMADNLPVFRDIEAAAKKSAVANPPDTLGVGWVAGMAVEESLKLCGWPCDRARLREAMERVRLDTKGLYGGPVDWSPNNHVRTASYHKVYRWDPDKQAIVVLKDWLRTDVE
jgi:branched-chain amino acid transport system substrate-binding protein